MRSIPSILGGWKQTIGRSSTSPVSREQSPSKLFSVVLLPNQGMTLIWEWVESGMDSPGPRWRGYTRKGSYGGLSYEAWRAAPLSPICVSILIYTIVRLQHGRS